MSLTPPLKVGKLQDGVAHQSEGLARLPILRPVRQGVPRRRPGDSPTTRCRSNDGAPGVDGQTFEDIEAYGAGPVAGRTGGRTPEPDVSSPAGPAGVHPQRRTAGQIRPLGIPCIKDRVVQMAAVLVLEPIFEADLEPEQHAYRPERSALDAVRQVERLLREGSHGGGRRRLERLLRQHPPRRAHEIGGPAHQRRPDAPADQDVAGDAGGRDRRRGRIAADDPQQGRREGDPARVSDLATVVEHLHATLCAGLEDRRATSADSRLTSSTMRTTS